MRKKDNMAEVKDNYAVKGILGRVGDLAVYKIITGNTFMTKYPDRSKVVYTKEQIEFREIFAKASRFASEIISGPVKKSTYPTQGRKSINQCALSDYMTECKRKKTAELFADTNSVTLQLPLLPHTIDPGKKARVRV